MTTIPMDEKQKEAMQRMMKLGLSKEVIDDFKEGTVNMSIYGTNVPIFDVLLNELIQRSGLKDPCIYYLIQDETGMTSILYVSNYKDDWEMERMYIDSNVIYAYVINHSEPSFSEIGAIGILNINGCLIRVS